MKNKLKNLILILGVVFFSFTVFIACPSVNTFRIITSQEAYDMMNNLENLTILDVRTASEFRQERIEYAINVPYNTIAQWVENQLVNENITRYTTILVYCQSGRRSRIASQRLVELDFINVYDFGGITDWPFETISG
ncbi:MAG: rhodanese-like domain-containing protein [Firmicutes bacterium]|nr:rhodanese-like domain-containing protein [Bacillota bacterium]